MGRASTFDRDTALAQARNLFWQLGYSDTAIPDLEHATGLRRSSLYHAFGTKKELFDLVINNYLNTIIRPLLTQITAEKADPSALHTYFRKLTTSIQTTQQHPGCLLIAAANAPIGQDPSVRQAITDYHNELEQTFTYGVHTSHPNLTMQEAQERAKVLVALTVSALALVRTNRDLAIENLTTAQILSQPAKS